MHLCLLWWLLVMVRFPSRQASIDGNLRWGLIFSVLFMLMWVFLFLQQGHFSDMTGQVRMCWSGLLANSQLLFVFYGMMDWWLADWTMSGMCSICTSFYDSCSWHANLSVILDDNNNLKYKLLQWNTNMLYACLFLH